MKLRCVICHVNSNKGAINLKITWNNWLKNKLNYKKKKSFFFINLFVKKKKKLLYNCYNADEDSENVVFLFLAAFFVENGRLGSLQSWQLILVLFQLLSDRTQRGFITWNNLISNKQLMSLLNKQKTAYPFLFRFRLSLNFEMTFSMLWISLWVCSI